MQDGSQAAPGYRQSFAWWSFTEPTPPPGDLLAQAKAIGFEGVDFLPEEHWPHAAELGLELVIIDGHMPLEEGFIDPHRHEELREQVRVALKKAVANNVRYVAVASGDRGPQTPEDAITACVEGLAPLAAEAEAAGVGLLLEPLNTKVDHAGHECASTAWAAEVVERVGSPALRILYDFYHSQIMEGDLLRTVDQYFPLIGHFHTAGVPGRHEIDERQEINYPAVAAHLRELGYQGFVSHEFVPLTDAAGALRQAFEVFKPR
ncbi:hydroxypyruvate isomerase [Catenulispora sp. GP43]|uniref:TIM barrel protein n=1 Tax=Catenulispora sp. GP43 TaxID=3156263 RepID=UPI0035126692